MVPVISLEMPGLSSAVSLIDLIATSLSAFFEGSQEVKAAQHTNNATADTNETILFITDFIFL